MKFVWGARKNRANLLRQGIAFEDAMKIFDGLTLEMVDDRFDYGESRYLAYGVIDDAAYCLVFTIRNGRYRPISLRQAHAKEMRRHAPES